MAGKERGREAPIVITPWAVADLVKRIRSALRERRSRRQRDV
jgi:hypothetical protein